jgi:hypothetical protein
MVYLVCLVCLVERNQPDEPNQPDQQNKPDTPDRNGLCTTVFASPIERFASTKQKRICQEN